MRRWLQNSSDRNAIRMQRPDVCCREAGQAVRSMIGTSRRGLSLLEVLVSVAIFLGALTAILYALGLGQRSELSARLQSEAVLRCEAVMAEFISGVREAEASDGNPFDDDETGNWTWTAQVEGGPGADLLQVTVVVEHRPGGSEPNAAFSLVRYMRDPQLFLDAAIEGAVQ
jgi:general secretion pathway protein I